MKTPTRARAAIASSSSSSLAKTAKAATMLRQFLLSHKMTEIDMCNDGNSSINNSNNNNRNRNSAMMSILDSLSPFQMQVYAALIQVPAGYVTTYQGLALAIHCKSYHAVGQALKRNPFAPAVPCHRVVATSRQLGGFRGTRSGVHLRDKKQLLLDEGVQFECDNNNNNTSSSKKIDVVDSSCLYQFQKYATDELVE